MELHIHHTHVCTDIDVSHSSSGSRWLLLLNSVYSKYMDWIEVFSLDASEDATMHSFILLRRQASIEGTDRQIVLVSDSIVRIAPRLEHY